MAAIPWMPLYVSDYLADTGHLGTIDHGAYFLMMMHYWTKGPLPSDDGQLRKIARMTPREWADARGVLLDFFQLDGGVYRHKRIDQELQIAAQLIDAKSKAGKEGAKKRWQTHSSRIRKQNASANSKPMAEPLADPIAERCERTAPLPLPVPREISKEEISLPRTPKRARLKELNGRAKDFEEFWRIYPKRVARGKAEKAYLKALGLANPAAILAGAKRYADLRAGEDEQYTAYPASWLNGKCWMDDFTADSSTPDADLQRLAALESEHGKKQ